MAPLETRFAYTNIFAKARKADSQPAVSGRDASRETRLLDDEGMTCRKPGYFDFY